MVVSAPSGSDRLSIGGNVQAPYLRLEAMEPAEGGGEMITDVGLYESRWAPVPHKFEAGTPPIAQAVGFGAAVDYLSALGMEEVRRHEIEITEYALARLADVPDLHVFGPTDLDVRGIAFAQVSAHWVGYEGIAADEAVFGDLVTPGEMGRGKFRNEDGEPIDDWDQLTIAWRKILLELADDFAAGNCRINPKQASLAEGQFAVLTRISELVRIVEDADVG